MLSSAVFYSSKYLILLSFQMTLFKLKLKVDCSTSYSITCTHYNSTVWRQFNKNDKYWVTLIPRFQNLYLTQLINGENHPEMATIDQNIGLVLYFSAQFDQAQAFFENALRLYLICQTKKVRAISKTCLLLCNRVKFLTFIITNSLASL